MHQIANRIAPVAVVTIGLWWLWRAVDLIWPRGDFCIMIYPAPPGCGFASRLPAGIIGLAAVALSGAWALRISRDASWNRVIGVAVFAVICLISLSAIRYS